MRRLLILLVVVCSSVSYAQRRSVGYSASSSKPFMTYDVGASSGSYNGSSYSEINLGINFNFTENITWRDAAFKRFSSNSTNEAGLDSTLRYNVDLRNENREGLTLFIGPGVRLATEKKSAALAEAGVQLSFGGLRVGGGAKYLKYFDPGSDSGNVALPKDEVQYFITLAGGGSF